MIYNFYKQRRIYVAGAFTAPTQAGIDANIEMAVQVGEYVRNRDEIPFVPHISILRGATWRLAMIECLSHIASCQAVVLVPGWERSRGARIEEWVARRLLYIPVYTLNQYIRSFDRLPLEEVACA